MTEIIKRKKRDYDIIACIISSSVWKPPVILSLRFRASYCTIAAAECSSIKPSCPAPFPLCSPFAVRRQAAKIARRSCSLPRPSSGRLRRYRRFPPPTLGLMPSPLPCASPLTPILFFGAVNRAHASSPELVAARTSSARAAPAI